MDPKNHFTKTKTASSVMEAEYTQEQVDQFMKTSFYLPVDVLKNPHWEVEKQGVITGKEFQLARTLHLAQMTLHCMESPTLLEQARHVGIQNRWNKKEGKMYTVAKIWYGRLPVGGLM